MIKKFIDKYKQRILGLLVLVNFLLGFFLGEVTRVVGIKRMPHSKGSYIKVTGQCKTRNGGSVVLTNDTIQTTYDDSKEIRGVLISGAKYVVCDEDSITSESFSVRDFFVKDAIQVTANEDTREIERDPIFDLEKKTVLASGVCYDLSKNKKVLTNKVLDILAIKEKTPEIHEITALSLTKSIELKCLSDNFKARIITDGDVQSFIDREKLESAPKKPLSLKGKVALVDGLCAKENTKKKTLLDLFEKQVKVYEEVVTKNEVVKIWGKTYDDNGEIVSVVCDKTVVPNIVFTETSLTSLEEKTKSKDSGETQVKFVSITGSCSESGMEKNYYDQEIKIIDSTKDSKGEFIRIEGVYKDEKVVSVVCDKLKNKNFSVEVKKGE